MKAELIKTIEKSVFKAEIFIDEFAENPRKFSDHFSTIVNFHPRYSIGDINKSDPDDFFLSCYSYSLTYDDVEKAKKMFYNDNVVLPVYMYDHSGITINTTGFSCSWDSGMVGIIYVSKKKIREEFNIKRISSKLIEKVKKIMVSEIEELDQFLTGDVYGYTLTNTETGEEIDSCWGFYGLDYIKEEINSSIDYYDSKTYKQLTLIT